MDKKKATELQNTEELEVSDLSDSQRIIATRICYAYQSKVATFKGIVGNNFLFKTVNTDCAARELKNDIMATLRYDLNNNLEFAVNDPTQLFVKSVQTDTVGYLAQLCTKIKNNEVINNTVVTGNVKTQVEFSRKDGDQYVLKTFTVNGDVSTFQSADTYSVRTQFNISPGQILGMDERFERQKVCPSGATPAKPNPPVTYSRYVQTFDKKL